MSIHYPLALDDNLHAFLKEQWEAERIAQAVSQNACLVSDPYPSPIEQETQPDAVIEVTYLEGSKGGKGGATFRTRKGFGAGVTHAELHYQVCFEEGFEWSKGGKLPGLYGGTGPTGGADNTEDGFSIRLMWRKDGQGELYGYWPGKDGSYGESVGRGNWQFQPGKWHDIRMEVEVNTPRKDNGYVKLWIDNELVINDANRILRANEGVKVDGVLFSTFFGGQDWESPKDQHAYFKDFSARAL